MPEIVPVTVCPLAGGAARAGSRWIFSGRTETGWLEPVRRSASAPSIRLEMPTKPATKAVCGRFVELGRRGHLLDAAVVEHGDAVAHRERLALVVGDVDEGDADPALDRLQLDLHLLAELQVERAQRLVQQQHARPVDQGAGERHALALAAGELRRLAAAEAGERHHGPASPRRAARRSGLRHLADHQPVADVLQHRHVREQRVVLEHGVDVAVIGRNAGDVLAVDRRRAAGRLLEAGDQAQAGGLAGAATAPAWRRTRRRWMSKLTSSTAFTAP